MKTRKALAIFMAVAMVFCYMPTTSVADVTVDTTTEVVAETEAAATIMSGEVSANEYGSRPIDMPSEDFWATAALQELFNNGLLNGFEEEDGTYIRPNDPLTRAQMVAIVNRAFGAVEIAELTGVTDVPEDAWYYREIQKAVSMGTMILDTKMRPNDIITRQEAFTILARALKLKGGEKADFANFDDASQVADWASSSIGAMVREGYIRGDNNLLGLGANMTRAQFAVAIQNIIEDGGLVLGADLIEPDDAVIPAAGGGGGGGGTTPTETTPPDTTPPRATASINGRTITYTFTEPIQFRNQANGVVKTLTTDMIDIYAIDIDGNYAEGTKATVTVGTASFDSTGLILTINYTGYLPTGTYVADTWGFTIEDLAGNAIKRNQYGQTFKSDTIAPTATVTHDNSRKRIVYKFSEAIRLADQGKGEVEAANINASHIKIYSVTPSGAGYDYKDTSSEATIGGVSWNATSNELAITYSGILAVGKYIVDAWGYSITDLAGNRIADEPATDNIFSAYADGSAPVIAYVSDACIKVSDILTWQAPTTAAIDNVDGDVSADIAMEYSSDDVGATVTGVESARAHLAKVGNTIKVTYNVSDAAGNAAEEVSATFSHAAPTVTITGVESVFEVGTPRVITVTRIGNSYTGVDIRIHIEHNFNESNSNEVSDIEAIELLEYLDGTNWEPLLQLVQFDSETLRDNEVSEARFTFNDSAAGKSYNFRYMIVRNDDNKILGEASVTFNVAAKED